MMNPLDEKDVVSLAREIAKAILQECKAQAIHIQGTIAAVPVDLHVRFEDGQ